MTLQVSRPFYLVIADVNLQFVQKNVTKYEFLFQMFRFSGIANQLSFEEIRLARVSTCSYTAYQTHFETKMILINSKNRVTYFLCFESNDCDRKS